VETTRATETGTPRPSRGFTLVELLVVIVVIGILAAIAIPVFLSQADKANDTALKSDLTNAAKLLQVAEANGEALPSEITAGQVVDLGSAGSFTASRTLSVTGSGDNLCVEGVSSSGTTYSVSLGAGAAAGNCAGLDSSTPISDGLILHVDAVDPTSLAATGTTWSDLSGTGNNGVFASEPTRSSDGGGSIQFDGGRYGNYADFSNTVDIDSTTTYQFWIKWSGDDYYQAVMGNEAVRDTDEYGFGIRRRLNGDYWISPRAGRTQFADATPTNTSTWHMVTATLNGTQARIYQNGQLLVSNENALPITSTQNFNIGRIAHIDDRGFRGNIAEVRVYDRALTPTEVQHNFNATRDRYGV